jgi:hypothetical protein
MKMARCVVRPCVAKVLIDRSYRLLCHPPDRRRFLSALSDLCQVQRSTE